MFGVGFFEMVIIGVFALVFVGPKRLPEVMRQAGRLFVHLRRTANDVRSTFDQVVREAENEIRREEAASLRDVLKPLQEANSKIQAFNPKSLVGHMIDVNIPPDPEPAAPGAQAADPAAAAAALAAGPASATGASPAVTTPAAGQPAPSDPTPPTGNTITTATAPATDHAPAPDPNKSQV